jgi:hypothetical protein
VARKNFQNSPKFLPAGEETLIAVTTEKRSRDRQLMYGSNIENYSFNDRYMSRREEVWGWTRKGFMPRVNNIRHDGVCRDDTMEVNEVVIIGGGGGIPSVSGSKGTSTTGMESSVSESSGSKSSNSESSGVESNGGASC